MEVFFWEFINFGLAKACEDLGDFKEPYKHYREGNALAKKHLKYDLGEDKEMFRLIKKSHSYISQNSLDGIFIWNALS